MMQKLVGMLVVISVLALLIAACGEAMGSTTTVLSPTPRATPTAIPQPNTVHMNTDQFVPNTVTIQKGKRLTLIDDVAVVHFIANGTWESSGNARYHVETGAPHIEIQFNGQDSHSVGPFNRVGTFHLYCTVHQGMNLTVIVQA